MYLPQGTELNHRYVIEIVLGHGGFGITYAAHDRLLKVRVAVKEYLPRQLATRAEGRTQVTIFTGAARQQYEYGLRKFLEEAQSVARFAHHPNVVSARDYFTANGTAYMVMEYVEGVTLKEYLAKKGGRISFEEAKGILMPVMDALREVHQAGMLHRDISPDNIYITTSAQVKILDFGAARYFAGEQSKSLSVILKSGYAPEEQYRRSGQQGPWTDIYAVGATLYKALTGQTPPDALDRLAQDTLEPPSRLGVGIPPPAERALLQALAVDAGQRFQSMGEFQQALLGDAAVTRGFQPAPALFRPGPEPSSPPVSAPTPVYAPPPPSHYPQAPRRSGNPAAIAAGVVVAIIVGVGLIWWQMGRDSSPRSGFQGQKEVQKPVIPDASPPRVQAPTPLPGKNRFTKAKDGVITDSATGLEWYVGPDRDTSWNQAKFWTENLTAAGGGWRMPTILELTGIYQKGASPCNMDPIFQTTGLWVWSGQLRDASSAWSFDFLYGRGSWLSLDSASYARALAMRPRQRNEVRPQTEDLRREVEKLAETIRVAHLNKDINKWLGCYHSSYPKLGQLENRQLELWKNYDIKEFNYRIANVQRVGDKEARAEIVWNFQLYDHRTHDYTLVRQAYHITLEKGPGGWKIADSREMVSPGPGAAQVGGQAKLDGELLKNKERMKKERLAEVERQRQAEATREKLRIKNEEKKRQAAKREAEERERQQKLQAEKQRLREAQRQLDEQGRLQEQLYQQRRP
jgi:serine/threonine protein kinase